MQCLVVLADHVHEPMYNNCSLKALWSLYMYACSQQVVRGLKKKKRTLVGLCSFLVAISVGPGLNFTCMTITYIQLR